MKSVAIVELPSNFKSPRRVGASEFEWKLEPQVALTNAMQWKWCDLWTLNRKHTFDQLRKKDLKKNYFSKDIFQVYRSIQRWKEQSCS